LLTPGIVGDTALNNRRKLPLNRPSSQWYSTVTFWPSMKPVSLRPLRKASTRTGTDDEALTKPTTGIVDRCAPAASGDAAAAPPSPAMNSRR
jgi:hypothetical protein